MNTTAKTEFSAIVPGGGKSKEILIDGIVVDYSAITNTIISETLKQLYKNPATTPEEEQLNTQIKILYKKIIGETFDSTTPANNQLSLSSIGLFAPGQAFVEAGKIIAEGLGMNVVFNPPSDYEITKNDLVITTLEYGTAQYTGLPTIQESKEKQEENTRNLKAWTALRINSITRAGVNFLICSDFPEPNGTNSTSYMDEAIKKLPKSFRLNVSDGFKHLKTPTNPTDAKQSSKVSKTTGSQRRKCEFRR